MTIENLKIPSFSGYVIHNPEKDLYSRGNFHYSSKIWGKNPKVWKNIGHLKNHLGMYLEQQYYPVCDRVAYGLRHWIPYDGSEIVYKIDEEGIHKITTVGDLLDEAIKRRNERFK